MGSVATRELGAFRLHALDAGLQRLDGGAMFGVVPKPLWQKKIPADDRTRIPLAMRPVLGETKDELVLIDSGAGNKEDDKFKDIYGIENDGAPTALEDSIRDAGFKPEDVTLLVNTHLHFDHAGGNTVAQPDGTVVPAFPGVRHYVQRTEWEFAHLQNERVRASYLFHNFEPVDAAALFELVAGTAGPNGGPPAAPLDHGLRRGTARHFGHQAGDPGPSRGGTDFAAIRA